MSELIGESWVPGPDKPRGRTRLLWAGGLALALCLWLVLTRGPVVVQEVRASNGAQRVESYAAEIRAAAAEFELDPYLLAGIMFAESSGRVDVVSSANALGLMQLSLGAAEDAARKLGLPPPAREDLLSDAALNVRLAARHLVWLFKHEHNDELRVLVAYNAGRTKLRRWINQAGGYEEWKRERVAAGDSGVLAYANRVQTWREKFRERSVISP